jgi:hypothetical protein
VPYNPSKDPLTHVSVVLDKTHDLLKALDELVNKSVFVGIPSTRLARKPVEGETDQPNNAVIGYTMENGDGARNIPPRPFLVPGVKSVQPDVVKRLREIGKVALDGDLNKMRSLREQLGLFTARAVQQKITDGPFTPLADATVEARARRGRKGAKKELARRAAGLPAGTDLVRPLIDTGQLRRAVTYVIGPNRSKKKTITAMTQGSVAFLGDKKP